MNSLYPTGYEIIFSDIDGTLIDARFQVPAATCQKIQSLSDSGVPFILVSARMPSGIWPIQKAIGITAPIICYSGALTLSAQGDCMESVGIVYDLAVQVEQLLRKDWPQVCSNTFSGDDWLTERITNPWVVREQSITASVPREGCIAECLAAGTGVHKFLCMGKAEDISALETALKKTYPMLAVHRSQDTYLEIMDGAASKAAALKTICRHYAVPVQAAVAFGDNYNDIDMLQAAGMSFAMDNAPNEVKRQARCVTLDNNHEGVLAGLEKLPFANRRNQISGSQKC